MVNFGDDSGDWEMIIAGAAMAEEDWKRGLLK